MFKLDENGQSNLLQEFQKITKYNKGSFSAIARNIPNATAVDLIKFSKGLESALNQEQKDALWDLIASIGARRVTGWYEDKDGKIQWTSGVIPREEAKQETVKMDEPKEGEEDDGKTETAGGEQIEVDETKAGDFI